MSPWSCINNKWNCATAPIQIYRSDEKLGIPLPVAQEAYKEYATQYGTSQSLERLNERGGFGWSELAILLYERIKRLEAKP